METKICTGCKEHKTLNAFYYYPKTNTYLSKCHSCRKAYQRERNKINWENNKEHLKTAWWKKSANDRWSYKESPAVYKIKNLLTGDCYIGESTAPNKRRGSHFALHKTKKGEFSLPELYNDMLHYGKEHFVFGIIEYINDKQERLKKEEYYINLYNTKKYNNFKHRDTF